MTYKTSSETLLDTMQNMLPSRSSFTHLWPVRQDVCIGSLSKWQEAWAAADAAPPIAAITAEALLYRSLRSCSEESFLDGVFDATMEA